MTSAASPAPCDDDAIGGCTRAVRAPAPAAPTRRLLLLRPVLGQQQAVMVMPSMGVQRECVCVVFKISRREPLQN
jgi:hypothetical protein